MDGSKSVGDLETCRVYVGNLPYGTAWQDLKDHMRTVASVVRADVFKGYGIVQFESASNAQKAISEMNGTLFGGRTLSVREDRENAPSRYTPSGMAGGGVARSTFHGSSSSAPFRGKYLNPYPQSKFGGDSVKQIKLFVGNLPFSAQWQDFNGLFGECKGLIRAEILYLPDGRSKGAGLLVFSNDSDAQNAINSFNGIEFQGRVIEVRLDRYS
eukprot:TRINITY_DN7659_c0_g1_i1.p1 TRINITY_DN7659_c0_g1~~TRINITY_DN7659_c0_g1_i1.p1  ORF type:complete len:213 (+),score=42.12 TRINITY_DN7659_c0_g1_i1:314-952(+)